jgi:hypothetical protein
VGAGLVVRLVVLRGVVRGVFSDDDTGWVAVGRERECYDLGLMDLGIEAFLFLPAGTYYD